MQHGLFSNSDCWILHPEHPPAFTLANEGYEIWLGNNRGNSHSSVNTKMKSSDPSYYDYSFQDLGMKDLPVQLDYVLNQTGHQKLPYVAHSQGTTQMFYALAKNQEEIAKRVKLFVALGPVTRMNNCKDKSIT